MHSISLDENINENDRRKYGEKIWRYSVIVGMFLLLWLGRAYAKQEVSETFPWPHNSLEQAISTAKRSDKAVLVYLGAAWCAPCQELKSSLFTDPNFSEFMKSVTPTFIDADSQEGERLTQKWKISGFPRFVFVRASERDIEILPSDATIDFAHFREALSAADLKISKLDSPDKLRSALSSSGHRRENALRIMATLNKDVSNNKRENAKAYLETLRSLPDSHQARWALAKNTVLRLCTLQLDTTEKKSLTDLLENTLASERNVYASRELILYSSENLLNCITTHFPDKAPSYVHKLIQQMESLRKDRQISALEAIASLNVEADAIAVENGNVSKKLSAETVIITLKGFEGQRDISLATVEASRLLRRMGCLHQGKELLRDALKNQPDNLKYIEAMGDFLRKIDENAEAIPWYKQAQDKSTKMTHKVFFAALVTKSALKADRCQEVLPSLHFIFESVKNNGFSLSEQLLSIFEDIGLQTNRTCAGDYLKFKQEAGTYCATSAQTSECLTFVEHIR